MSEHPYISRLALPQEVRRATIPVLQARLSDTLDLFAHLKQAHWNVTGPQFIALHELFDRPAEEVEDASDEIAERIVALGGLADGRVQATFSGSGLPGFPATARLGPVVLAAVAQALSAHGQALRGSIAASTDAGDADSADLRTGLSRQADKSLWLVEAHRFLDD